MQGCEIHLKALHIVGISVGVYVAVAVVFTFASVCVDVDVVVGMPSRRLLKDIVLSCIKCGTIREMKLRN